MLYGERTAAGFLFSTQRWPWRMLFVESIVSGKSTRLFVCRGCFSGDPFSDGIWVEEFSWVVVLVGVGYCTLARTHEPFQRERVDGGGEITRNVQVRVSSPGETAVCAPLGVSVEPFASEYTPGICSARCTSMT